MVGHVNHCKRVQGVKGVFIAMTGMRLSSSLPSAFNMGPVKDDSASGENGENGENGAKGRRYNWELPTPAKFDCLLDRETRARKARAR